MTLNSVREKLPDGISERDFEHMDFGTYAAVVEGDYP